MEPLDRDLGKRQVEVVEGVFGDRCDTNCRRREYRWRRYGREPAVEESEIWVLVQDEHGRMGKTLGDGSNGDLGNDQQIVLFDLDVVEVGDRGGVLEPVTAEAAVLVYDRGGET